MAVRWDGCSSFRERTQSLWNTLSHIRHGYCSSQASNSFRQMWQISFSLKKKQNHKNKGGVYPSMNEWINNRNNATTVRKLIFCRQLKNFLFCFVLFFYNCRTFYILWIFCLHLRKPIVVHSATDETKLGSNQFTNIKQFVCIWIMRIPWIFFFYNAFKRRILLTLFWLFGSLDVCIILPLGETFSYIRLPLPYLEEYALLSM